MIDEQTENRILVIGNGFDSANKLKTKYKDFIEFLKNFDSEKWECEKNDEIEELIKTNSFILHLINVEEDFENWMNLEEEIHEIVIAIQSVYNKIGNNVERKGIADNIVGSVITKLDKYTKTVLIEFKLFENIFGHFCLSSNYLDQYGRIMWEKLIEYLSTQFQGLKKTIALYLKYYVPIEHENSNDRISKEARKQIMDIEPNYVLTFNYTDTYNNYGFNNVRHLHGSLEDNNIVLGFFDDENVDDEYSGFKKSIQITSSSIRRLSENDDELNVDNTFMGQRSDDGHFYSSNILYFFGFSFDECDKEYIRILLTQSNVSKIIIYYYDEKAKNDITRRISSIMKNHGFERLNISFVQVVTQK